MNFKIKNKRLAKFFLTVLWICKELLKYTLLFLMWLGACHYFISIGNYSGSFLFLSGWIFLAFWTFGNFYAGVCKKNNIELDLERF